MAEKNLRIFTPAEWAWIISADHQFLVSVRVGLDPGVQEVPVELLVEDFCWLFDTAEVYLNAWGNTLINQKMPNNIMGTNCNRLFPKGNDD